MNPNAPINKNRRAYREVVRMLIRYGYNAILVRNNGIESIEINGEVAMVYSNKRGAFPPAVVNGGVRLIAVYCYELNTVAAYSRAGDDTWKFEFAVYGEVN